jgi:hypothetical protein
MSDFSTFEEIGHGVVLGVTVGSIIWLVIFSYLGVI